MRFVRLAALVGSLVLLVATSVSLFNRRAELRTEQDVRVVAESLRAQARIESLVLRARAVTEIAGPGIATDALTETFGDLAAACVEVPAETRCSGADLPALESYGDAAAASARRDGRAVAVADVESESVLVVSQSDRTVALQLPVTLFAERIAANTFGGADTTVLLVLSEQPATDLRTEPTTVEGRRAVSAVDGSLLDAGSVLVTASVEDEVGIAADAPVLFGSLLAVGTVLLALAGWTYLVDRRSLERRATTDELTGLINRREFEHETEEALEMAQRFGTGLCVMVIDLNGFKQINDTMGHQFGDVVLKACAERLIGAVRDTDIVGRWGGDEFVILLPGLEDGTAVRNSAERIAAGLSRTPVAGDVYVSASVGAALFPRHGVTLEELIRNADVAMYGAKSAGVTLRVADPVGAPDDAGVRRGYDGPERRGSRRGSRV